MKNSRIHNIHTNGDNEQVDVLNLEGGNGYTSVQEVQDSSNAGLTQSGGKNVE